jgi:hypothetical protein
MEGCVAAYYKIPKALIFVIFQLFLAFQKYIFKHIQVEILLGRIYFLIINKHNYEDNWI